VGDGKAPFYVGGVGIAEERGGLEGSERFEAFAASDGEGASLVGASDAACALCDVEHGAFGCAEGLVAELRVTDLGGLDGEQELYGDLVSDETMVRKPRRSGLVGHAPHRAGSVTPRLRGGAIRARHGVTDQPRPTSARRSLRQEVSAKDRHATRVVIS